MTKIVIDTKVSPAFSGADFPTGSGRVYETIAGRVFGELDPTDSHNTIIQDLQLAPRNAAGKVEYSATFFLVKPIDMSKSSHLMWQDVPNRGGRITIPVLSRNDGDIGLSSGWQGDNSGDTAQVPAPGNTNDYAVVPVPHYADGSPVTAHGIDYALGGTESLTPLLREIRSTLRGAALGVESARAECHPGQYEIVLRTTESPTGSAAE